MEDTLQQTIAQSNTLGQKAAQITGVAFNPLSSKTVDVNKPVDASGLANVTPFNLPTTPIPTAGAGLQGQMEALVAQNRQKQADAVKTASVEKEETKKGLVDTMKQLLGKGAEQLDLEEEAKIDEKAQLVTDYTNKIEAEQLALARQVEQIQTGAGTATADQRNAAAQEIQRVSLRKQADLAILQSAANRDLTTAQATIDRKIELKYEPLEQQLEFFKFFYDENRDALSKAEDRQLQQMITDETRQYDQLVQQDQRAYDAYLNAAANGAPQSVQEQIISAIDRGDYQGALSMSSAYAVDPLDRQSKLASINAANLSARKSLFELAQAGDQSAIKQLGLDPNTKKILTPKEASTVQKEMAGNDAYKAIQKSKDSLVALQEYEKVFNKVGPTSGVTSPFDNAKLKTAYNTATLNLKEFFNLGVLNGPDLEVIQGVLGNPTNQGLPGIGNVVAGVGAKAGIKNMYKQIEQSIDDRYLLLSSQYGQYDSSQIGLLNDLNRTYLQTKAAVNPDVAKFLSENPNITVEDAVRVINTKL